MKNTIFYNIQLSETHPSGSSAKGKEGSSTRSGVRQEILLFSANVPLIVQVWDEAPEHHVWI